MKNVDCRQYTSDLLTKQETSLCQPVMPLDLHCNYSGIINTTCRSVVMKLSHFGLILFRVISVKYQKKDDL